MQEIERESQVEEKRSDDHDYGDDMKDSNILSRGACADDVKLKTKETMRANHARSRSLEVVSGARIVQCHAIIDVVIDVRVMQCHASMDVVIGVRVMLCHQATDNSGFSTLCPNSHLVVMLYHFIITFPCSHFVHTFAPRKLVI